MTSVEDSLETALLLMCTLVSLGNNSDVTLVEANFYLVVALVDK